MDIENEMKKKEIYIVDNSTLTVQMIMKKDSPSGEEFDYTAVGFSTMNFPEVGHPSVSSDFDLVLGFRTLEAIEVLIEQLNEIKKYIPA